MVYPFLIVMLSLPPYFAKTLIGIFEFSYAMKLEIYWKFLWTTKSLGVKVGVSSLEEEKEDVSEYFLLRLVSPPSSDWKALLLEQSLLCCFYFMGARL
jgi:hypothetical protein